MARRALKVAAVILLPGAALVIAAYFVWTKIMAGKISSGLAPSARYPNMARFVPLVSAEVAKRFILSGPERQLEIAKLVMAIIYQESKGSTDNYVGDVGLPGGPSIGPMQVYFKSAKDYSLVPSTMTVDEYMERAYDEDWGIMAGVYVFSRKLREAGGDIDRAVARYNGGGAAAQSYAQSVFSNRGEIYG